MDSWHLVLFSLVVGTAAGLSLLLRHHRNRRSKPPLPPGPLSLPVIGNPMWLTRWSITNIEHHLRHDLHPKYGPIVSLKIGSRLSIFISDSSLAHEALIQQGSALADRVPALPAARFLSSNHHNVSGARYGPLWRALRRNLSSEILHPSRYTKLYSPARRWVLDLLLDALRAESGAVVRPQDHFQFAMFCLLVLMCFGEKLDRETIRQIEVAQRQRLLYGRNLNVLAFAPWITAHLFRRRLATAAGHREVEKKLYLPLIEARRQHKLRREVEGEGEGEGERFVFSYVDSLLDLNLPEEEGGRKLTDEEIVTLCSEFLTGGTDTTATALQWIMANLVKHQEIQRKVFDEILSTVGMEQEAVVDEGDLQRMPYLKAVVTEGLRRHPPARFVLPHAAAEDTTVGGYLVPKGAAVNFVVGEINWDERAWKEPMEFRPERFVDGGEGEGLDITGNRGITMMPFGAGRRICPGIALAMLHLQYLVGNLVKEFRWTPAADGEDVDLSEKTEFTVVMNHPLMATITPRR